MKSVDAALDKAPAGHGRDAALKYQQATETARTAKNDGACICEAGAARHALP